MVKFFVKNVIEEFVCNIKIEPPNDIPDMIVVTDYTRESKYMQGESANRICHVSPLLLGDRTRFLGFLKYLFDRGKVI